MGCHQWRDYKQRRNFQPPGGHLKSRHCHLPPAQVLLVAQTFVLCLRGGTSCEPPLHSPSLAPPYLTQALCGFFLHFLWLNVFEVQGLLLGKSSASSITLLCLPGSLNPDAPPLLQTLCYLQNLASHSLSTLAKRTMSTLRPFAFVKQVLTHFYQMSHIKFC